MEQCEDGIRIIKQQSEVSLQIHARGAGKWHVDSEVEMGSGPVVFPVLLWRCLETSRFSLFLCVLWTA